MTSQSSQSRPAGRRPATRRLAAGGLAAVAALATLSLTAGGAAASVSRAGRGGGELAAASSGGTVRAWGENFNGQLGDGSTGNIRTSPVPVSLPPGISIISVRAGCDHTLALTSTGQVLAWGFNGSGQLGDGSTGDGSAIPVKVSLPPGTTVTAISAGCDFSMARTSTGHVLAWGRDESGELGDGTTTSSSTPVPVSLPPFTKVTAISAGFAHSLALTSTGQVLAWGSNDSGQLGNGTTGNASDTPIPVAVPAGTTVTAIATGFVHSLALTSTGQVLAWGANTFGELGDGTTSTESDTPVQAQLPAGTRVQDLAAGCGHTLALTSKGHLLAWGLNDSGQLGDGATGGSSDIPVQVTLSPDTQVTAISAGCDHSLARISTGLVLAWGNNVQGQIGNGTTTSSDVPVQVQLPTTQPAIAIGSGPLAAFSLAILR